MHYMFHWASAFDQDLGWCIGNDVNLDGVSQRVLLNVCASPKDETGDCQIIDSGLLLLRR